MKIIWEIGEHDVQKVSDFVSEQKNQFVESTIARNVNKNNSAISKDKILKAMLISLMTYQQNPGSAGNLSLFLRKEPFLLTNNFLFRQADVEKSVLDVLVSNGLTRYFDNVPRYFMLNYRHLFLSNWDLLAKLEACRVKDMTVNEERELADHIDKIFKGFGSRQARRFLLLLGLTKYEIPIGVTTIDWLKRFGFPITCSPIALQDKSFYHFVSNGIQLLCEKASVFPCVLDAAILTESDIDYFEV